MPESRTTGTVGLVVVVAAATSVVVSLALLLLLGPGSDDEGSGRQTSVVRESAQRPDASEPALAALRDALAQERTARLALARQIDELRQELARNPVESAKRLSPASPGAAARSEGAQRATGDSESEFAELWFSEQALGETGLSEREIRRLRRLFDGVELEKLEARDSALREGWSSSSRHSRELREIRDRFREEVGEDNYDRVLYASGRRNRVRVRDLLRGSAAETSGVEIGDVIVRYGGKRVFDPTTLYIWTTQGDRGESVELEVLRGDETVVLAVARGPLGGKLEHFVAAPGR